MSTMFALPGSRSSIDPEVRLSITSTFTEGDDNILPAEYDPAVSCVFACDITGLDGSSGGIIHESGAAVIGHYCGFNGSGDFYVRCGGGSSALPDTEAGYLTVDSANAPSGDGTLVWEVTPGTNTVRAWWNGTFLGAPVARSSGTGNWMGSDPGAYLAIPNSNVLTGGSTSVVTYTTASGLRYYENQTVR